MDDAGGNRLRGGGGEGGSRHSGDYAPHCLKYWCHVIFAFAPTFAHTLSWCYFIDLMYQMIIDTDEEVG